MAGEAIRNLADLTGIVGFALFIARQKVLLMDE